MILHDDVGYHAVLPDIVYRMCHVSNYTIYIYMVWWYAALLWYMLHATGYTRHTAYYGLILNTTCILHAIGCRLKTIEHA